MSHLVGPCNSFSLRLLIHQNYSSSIHPAQKERSKRTPTDAKKTRGAALDSEVGIRITNGIYYPIWISRLWGMLGCGRGWLVTSSWTVRGFVSIGERLLGTNVRAIVQSPIKRFFLRLCDLPLLLDADHDPRKPYCWILYCLNHKSLDFWKVSIYVLQCLPFLSENECAFLMHYLRILD